MTVDELCATWDSDNGDCLSCYNGYELDGRDCVVRNIQGNVDNNLLCESWEGSNCLNCSTRAYFNS